MDYPIQEMTRYKRNCRQQVPVAAAKAGDQAVHLANQLYPHEVGDFLSVSQESLYSSEDRLVQSQRDAATNLIGLYKALGGGWE